LSSLAKQSLKRALSAYLKRHPDGKAGLKSFFPDDLIDDLNFYPFSFWNLGFGIRNWLSGIWNLRHILTGVGKNGASTWVIAVQRFDTRRLSSI
jgi:hypothetical protein